jgi:hypothetical protein
MRAKVSGEKTAISNKFIWVFLDRHKIYSRAGEALEVQSNHFKLITNKDLEKGSCVEVDASCGGQQVRIIQNQKTQNSSNKIKKTAYMAMRTTERTKTSRRHSK